MAKALGYGKAITHLDVDRVYYPVGLGHQSQTVQEIAEELLRVLRQAVEYNLCKHVHRMLFQNQCRMIPNLRTITTPSHRRPGIPLG